MMSGISGLVIAVAAVVITIVVSRKTGFNMGIMAMAMAMVVGCMLGGMKVKAVLAEFDTDLFLLQFIPMLFFAEVQQCDAFGGIVDRIVYASRKRGWMIPFALWAATFFIGAIGAGNYGTPAIASPIAFALARSAGFSPLIASYIVYSASLLCAYMPWNSNTLNLTGIALNYVDEATAANVLTVVRLVLFTFMILIFLGIYFVKKGYKSKAIEVEKPAPLTPEQKKVLIVLAVFLAVVCLPGILNLLIKNNPVISWAVRVFDVRAVCLFGTFVLHVMRLGNVKEALTKKVPWNTILLITGMSSFINVLNSLGVFETVGDIVNNNLPTAAIPFALALTCALLGAVTAGISTVMPAFTPIAYAFAQSAGLNTVGIMALVMTTPTAASVSPLSTGGSFAMVGATEEERSKLFVEQFIVCGIQIALMVVLAGIGLHLGLADLLGF